MPRAPWSLVLLPRAQFLRLKVGLLLPGVFVGVRFEIVWIGTFEFGLLAMKLLVLVGVDRRANLVSLIPLFSLSVVALSAAALHVVAPFV